MKKRSVLKPGQELERAREGKPVTLKDVAKAAGVHFTTVSLVLQGRGVLALATRARVQEVAKRLGYRKDSVSMALTLRRSAGRIEAVRPVIAFLSNCSNEEEFYLESHRRMFFEGAQKESRRIGYECRLLLVGAASPSDSEIMDILSAWNTQAVILGGFIPLRRVPKLDWDNLTVVRIHSEYLKPAFHTVSNDQLQAVRLAVEELHAVGYRRMGLAVGRIDEDGTDNMYTAAYYLEAQRRHFIELEPFLFAYDEADGARQERFNEWVLRMRPEVVLSNWSSIVSILKAASLVTTWPIAAVSLCKYEDGDGDLAGVVQDHVSVGRKAVEEAALLVSERHTGAPSLPSATYVAPRWTRGASAPPRESV